MKIRTQFSFILIGIILIPVLIVGIIIVFNRSEPTLHVIVPGYVEVSELTENKIEPQDWKEVTRRLKALKPQIQYTIFDDQNVALVSTIPEFFPGRTYQPQNKNTFFFATGTEYFYQVDIIKLLNDDSLILLTRTARDLIYKPVLFENPIKISFIILMAIFGFCALSMFLLGKSITKSISILDSATKRIAQGELSIELPQKGLNEIVSLTSSLNKMRKTLQEEEVRKTKFVMGISHDLRTPISLIKGYTEALKDDMFPSEEMKKKSLQLIITKTDQLNEGVDEIIDFIKLKTVEWCDNLKEKRIKPILDNFSKRIKEDVAILQKTVYTNINIPENFTMKIDEKLFIRCLENLVINSYRYTDIDGHIWLIAEMSENERPIIKVSDDGQGISEKDIPFVFDPLYRGTNSRREKGQGLGLAIVKAVVDSHGWKIEVISKPGKGTEFTIFM